MIHLSPKNASTFVKFGQWIQRVKVLQSRVIRICIRRLHTEDMTHQVSQDEGKGWIRNFKVLWQVDQRVLRADLHRIMVNCSCGLVAAKGRTLVCLCGCVFAWSECPYSETERPRQVDRLSLSSQNITHAHASTGKATAGVFALGAIFVQIKWSQNKGTMEPRGPFSLSHRPERWLSEVSQQHFCWGLPLGLSRGSAYDQRLSLSSIVMLIGCLMGLSSTRRQRSSRSTVRSNISIDNALQSGSQWSLLLGGCSNMWFLQAHPIGFHGRDSARGQLQWSEQGNT